MQNVFELRRTFCPSPDILAFCRTFHVRENFFSGCFAQILLTGHFVQREFTLSLLRGFCMFCSRLVYKIGSVCVCLDILRGKGIRSISHLSIFPPLHFAKIPPWYAKIPPFPHCQDIPDEWGMGMNGDEWGSKFTHSSVGG